ncbi:DMT family transporter [Pseudomonas sp. SZMC_28357]|uniref:DMT family transporter n=1 Tax=Pseudomonas sp. SZMC_28357 TaxID=3074380 RepID=UPI0028712776|nr:DMT family transporter [Pseudomonas sp. SZMC_28357]MDR9751497.1 DMT family transporter [Pseudomonas sp. SZMC_28357]
MNSTNSLSVDAHAKPDWRQTTRLPLLEAGLILTWSSGFVGARFSIDYAPALLVVFWRCVVIALILLPFVAKSLRRTSLAVLLVNAGIGLLAMAGYLAGVIQGIALGVPAGLAAVFANLLPMAVAVLAAVFLKHRLPWQIWLGLVIGLVGVVLVTLGALAWGNAPLWAYGLPVLGTLSLAVATLWQKQLPAERSMDLLPNLWLQCCVSAVAFGLIEGWQGSLAPIYSAGFAMSVLWTVALSTLGGYGLYWICLQRSSPTRVASVLYLCPPVTMIWAWVMFSEPLTVPMVLGMAVSGVGIWMVVRAENRQPALI